ncbi:gametocyte-specific factor 1 [Pholidichthys leucotaenia]
MAFSFGFSSDPLRVPSAGRACVSEDGDDKKRDEEDEIVLCPYDKNHKIRQLRLPYHLIKCGKNHPKLARELKTCPYNACHLIPKQEMAHHTRTCKDRGPEEGQEGVKEVCKWHVPVSTWKNPDQTEDWDQDSEGAAPFIWGQNAKKEKPKPNKKHGPAFSSPQHLP